MPSPKSINPQICAKLLQSAGNVAVLTGAGISTAAGVPDFRGPRGLYVTRQYDPERVFEIDYFDHNPGPFYEFSRDLVGVLQTIQPTFTHRFLAGLEAGGRQVTVITQNIDGLHQQAGSSRVLPMHGDYETSHCRRCSREFSGRSTLEHMMAQSSDGIPRCPCGGVIKPDIVFFGEAVRHLDESLEAVAASDLLLVLGSSLTVYPAASLPSSAGGDVVVVNQGPIAAGFSKEYFHTDSGLDDFFTAVAEYKKS